MLRGARDITVVDMSIMTTHLQSEPHCHSVPVSLTLEFKVVEDTLVCS
jgi:hypothetical protein